MNLRDLIHSTKMNSSKVYQIFFWKQSYELQKALFFGNICNFHLAREFIKHSFVMVTRLSIKTFNILIYCIVFLTYYNLLKITTSKMSSTELFFKAEFFYCNYMRGSKKNSKGGRGWSDGYFSLAGGGSNRAVRLLDWSNLCIKSRTFRTMRYCNQD